MDIKYEGKLADGTLYTLNISFEDEGLYKRIAHALEKQKAKGIVESGLLKTLSDLEKTLPLSYFFREEIFKDKN